MAHPQDEKWVRRFIELATTVSNWSHDPSTKVGAIIATESCKIAGQGYNGLFRGLDDNMLEYISRDEKLKFTAHAEANAFANRIHVPDSGNLYLFVTKPICLECAKLTVLNNIKAVYCSVTDDPTFNSRWKNKDAKSVLEAMGIEYYEVYPEDDYKIVKIN